MRTLATLFFAVFCGCSNNGTSDIKNSDSIGASMHTTDAADTLVTDNTPVMLTGCYQMTLKGDTVTMNIDLLDSTVTGNLDYRFKEKDTNSGTLKGVIRDRYIYADYTFHSEGTTSIREVVFKVEGNTLVPGFGDIVEQDKKIIFTNKEAIQFQDETPFLKVTCPK
jgi:hypothetical protein